MNKDKFELKMNFWESKRDGNNLQFNINYDDKISREVIHHISNQELKERGPFIIIQEIIQKISEDFNNQLQKYE